MGARVTQGLYIEWMEELEGTELTYTLSVYHFRTPSAG